MLSVLLEKARILRSNANFMNSITRIELYGADIFPSITIIIFCMARAND